MRTLLTRASRVLAPSLRSSTGSDATAAAAANAAVARAAVCTVEALEGRRLLSTYYVSPYGSDSNSGTSSSKPWRTISKVNGRNLNAGDKVLFRGGSTFSGEVRLGSEDAGTSGSPVTIGSYGSGRATIRSGASRGIAVHGAGGIRIENLNVVATSTSRTNYGIKIANSSGRKNYIRINNVSVSGFGEYGINVVGERGTAGFNDVRITNVTATRNVIAGIKVHNTTKSGIAHTNVYIGGVKAYDNPGSTRYHVSGSGILVSHVDRATIERSVAYNNSASGKGAIGIWAHDSNRVTIQYNEVYGQRTRSSTDGSGLGFDTNTRNSLMQYNWSHDNDGHGINLAQWRNNSSFNNNVVRYNVLEDNGRKNGYGGISMWGRVLNAYVHNNTIHQKYQSRGSGPNRGIRIFKAGVEANNGGNSSVYPDNIYVRNNIIIARGGARLVEIASDVTRSGVDIHFQGNAYWTYGSKFEIRHGSGTYSSLSSWRSRRGQEKLNGRSVGFQVDPKLYKPGQGWTVGNAYKLGSMNAYKLNSSSPLHSKSISVGTLAGTSGKDLGAGAFSSSSGTSGASGSSSGSGSDSGSGSGGSGSSSSRPRVLSSTASATRVTLRFSESVFASLGRSDIVISNRTRGGTVGWGWTRLTYDKSTQTATITFPGLTNDRLRSGTYDLRVLARRVQDASGLSMGSDYTLRFRV